MNRNYDAIIIGGGSVGVPAALFLTFEGLRVLVVEANPSVGQGQNKAAIGGVRATHSDAAKILLCQESLRIFGEWEETYGHDIGWKKGGYCFPAYTHKEENTLKGLLPIQKSYGLKIDWLDPEEIEDVVPGIRAEGLMGGTFSPDDAQVSPLLAIDAMFRLSKERGCAYRFGERAVALVTEKGRVKGITTDRETYNAPVVLNAAGASAMEVGKLAGIDVPVMPDSHEAGISAPMEQFLGPLVVDLRPGPEGKTSNFYFAQNHEGVLIFCYTPIEPVCGTNREPTSEFLPVVARRLIGLLPRLKNMLVRRVWRGLYPMTPDGLPICDKVREPEGLYLAVGMCGQGFMMGPGIGRNMAHLIVHGSPLIAEDTFETLSLYRDFYASKKEALK
ncbi:MAG: FAD-binding oxidoreductase [Deltaproteobacteria bacterium]|nr:FAD-binding oxidoreductase [Deltaproteobacteria bacterium]